MGKNKGAGREQVNGTTQPKPLLDGVGEAKPTSDAHTENVSFSVTDDKTGLGINVTKFGTANPGVGLDTRQNPGSLYHSPSSQTHYIQGLYWQTGDVQVLVGGTHEFRLHQEILSTHSKFFSDQLRASTDSDGIIVAPRSEDIPVIVIRDITGEAFDDILRLIYPPPSTIKQPRLTLAQVERLVQTASALGMPGVLDFAMDILSRAPGCSAIQRYRLAQRLALPGWQIDAVARMVYRTRPLTHEEADILGSLVTVQVARFREFFRARMFARFEPVVRREGEKAESQAHRGGSEPEAVASLDATVASGGLNLGRCQLAIYAGLKMVFDVDGNVPELEQYAMNEESFVMDNLEACLRLGGIGGRPCLCGGCLESIDRITRTYCRVDEMNAKIERELVLEPENVSK
ncbi:hypothetical protein FRC07_010262 [Ceratobasidium sp. 392]|nr:hypothetical protein FRC07_010262 [Ceratobasidium sp. 392]